MKINLKTQTYKRGRSYILDNTRVNKDNQLPIVGHGQLEAELNHNFRVWFGDSKVVDGEGRPRVMWHGTGHDFLCQAFEAFRTDNDELGSHFGTYTQAKMVKDGHNKYMFPVYLSIQNPLRLIDIGTFQGRDLLSYGNLDILNYVLGEETVEKILAYGWTCINLQSLLAAKGYDGIVYLNRFESHRYLKGKLTKEELAQLTDEQALEAYPDIRDSYIAFLPTQIKSVYNKGSFSLRNPNIYY